MFPPYPQYEFFRFLRRHVPPTGPGPVVDAPCGMGYISYLMAAAFPAREVLGADIDQACIKDARQTFLRDNLAFQAQDIHSFLDASGKIDVYLLVNSIFLLPEPEAILNKIYQKLTDQGRLVIIIPNTDSANFQHFQRIDPHQNTLILDKEAAKAFFAEAGFQVVSVKGVCFTTIYGNRLLPRLGKLRGFYTYAGNTINRLAGKKPSYWGFLLEKK